MTQKFLFFLKYIVFYYFEKFTLYYYSSGSFSCVLVEMSMRDRPRLSDRFRGKSGNDLMNEIKKEFEDSKKAWFADRPSSHFNSLRRVRIICLVAFKRK